MATEADIHFPWDAVDPENPTADETVDESKWRRMFRAWVGSGVRAGVANELECFADSTGRQVKLRTGEISVESHVGVNSAEETIAVTTNATGSNRFDRLVARADFVNNVIEWDVLVGTTSPPALTQNSTIWEVPIAQIGPLANGYSTIEANKITDERGFLTPYGAPAFADADARDLWVPSPESGFQAWLRDIDFLSVYDGSAWSTPGWSTWSPTYNSTITVGDGTVVARYRRSGNQVTIQFRLITGSTSAFDATGPLQVSLPFAAVTSSNFEQHFAVNLFDNSLDDYWPAIGVVSSAGSLMSLYSQRGTSTGPIDSTEPFAWNGAEADEIHIFGTYECAT